MTSQGGPKNVKSENVPLLCGYMDQEEKKSLKDCMVSINIQPTLCRLKLLIPLNKAQKVCLVGTLNLYLRVPDKMQKTDPSRLGKLPKTAQNPNI